MKGFYRNKLEFSGAALAPMAGYTDAPFRRLCRDYGSLWAVTEMVSAKAVVLGDEKSIRIGEPYPGEPELVIQLFGGEAEIVAEAGRILYEHYRPVALDLNMGCPVKKVTGKSCGSKLMQDPARAADIIRALNAAVPVAVSAKMRLGYDVVNAHEVAKALEEAGAALVTVHGRTAAQKYTGEADWETIAEVAAGLDIPVVGSGDVTTREQYERYRGGGLGVMIGRGAVGRPWIFAELRGEASPSPTGVARLAYRHAVMACAAEGQHAMLAMRSKLLKYFEPDPYFAAMRPEIISISSLTELAAFIEKHYGINPQAEGQLEAA